ncbi:DUF317 domain-containing protein [Streptomyces sp. NRRL S-146]|uniref:DUF317 domain-containing protein n=1 Tax=Streptomyces sp. NRRL S-146 TaxID=1463884 RepID=UPI002D21E75C|nr:DUF317 domain-containing protein [Streptomyces sp. NRRL S-146]
MEPRQRPPDATRPGLQPRPEGPPAPGARPQRPVVTLRHVAEPDRPAWYASFGARTAVELIAAFTDALTDPAPPLTRLAIRTESSGRPAGHRTVTTALLPPDKTAYVERLGTPADPEAWFAAVTLGMHQKVWQARFGAHTPPHLVAAFTAALGDPKPVHRTTAGAVCRSSTRTSSSAGRPMCSPCTSPARWKTAFTPSLPGTPPRRRPRSPQGQRRPGTAAAANPPSPPGST